MGIGAQYQDKLVRPEEAVKVVRSGDWIDYGFCTTTSAACDRALAARYETLSDVKIRGGVLLRRPAVADVPDAPARFTWHSWHMSGIERRMAEEGAAYYIPIRYSEVPRYYREHMAPIRAAFFQVGPMDGDGNFNLGLSASHAAALCERCEYVFVEVNRNMPRCFGKSGNTLHLSRVSGIVNGDAEPVLQLPSAPPTPVDEAVARQIVAEIPDGACLQLGIGGMPNAVGGLLAQSGLRNLGVHTEMYVDAFADLAEAGMLNGSQKNIDRGLQTYTFAAGTQRLYDYLDGNQACSAMPVDYTNDIRVIAQLDRFISVNNAVEVDLWGQVSAESSGLRHISGAGGQLDFVLGAYLSQGGKSFICCSSTVETRDGALKSRICPTLPPGSIVTGVRAALHYLVTEYGMVNLKGASTWERAEKIISVAHPRFRDALIASAGEMRIWRRSNRR